ncbi:hypothetical protein GGI26_004703 [Coemansia sp. RSA 1358]|uniref:Uncharacterized protein n=1 Tax=Coemansia umbellata TaxID=1424467 RepID=A0ABQ8PJU1_9FUNG|nr:hypothetical protein EDC05_004042 [Coemansia umbellata]KAJ2620807.1 hypothetical protein GGI26_004703 [Coemansia sp. RSA 1358]
MIFSRQDRLLRISKSSCLSVHVYLQERNVPWFTDAVFQEILQAIRPALQEKIDECQKGVRSARLFQNRAFQVAYYVDKLDNQMHILTQELAVKSEDENANTSARTNNPIYSQFEYKSLWSAKCVLILVAEPFDANNSIALPPILNECVETRNIESAWSAYMELRDLEGAIKQVDLVNQLHKMLPASTLHSIVHALLPACDEPMRVEGGENADKAARSVYMFTKILNYLLLVSKLKKNQRNSVAIVKKTMGQCVRRFIGNRHAQTTDDAQNIVELWKRMSKESSKQLGLDLFDIYMMILGAWKADRFTLIPHLYRLACDEWYTGNEKSFQRISAVVLSFYVRECGHTVQMSAIKELLDDLDTRLISISPTHYSMLILYFGVTRRTNELLKVLDEALSNPDAGNCEATYYNTFRAISLAFASQHHRKGQTNNPNDGNICIDISENATGQSSFPGENGNNGMEYIDDFDADIEGFDMRSMLSNSAHIGADGVNSRFKEGTKHSPEELQVAKICTSLFQSMITSGVTITSRTYRELIHCMVQLNMRDKAHKIFLFAIENLEPKDITAHFISLYMRSITRTARHAQYVLRWYVKENQGLLYILEQFPKKALVDHFGIFNGDLRAFMLKEKRLAAADASDKRNEMFMYWFVKNMRSANKAAQFINCAISGNDPEGKFVGYNFSKLKKDGSGLLAVEGSIVDICQHIHTTNGKWLRNKNIIHNLLPVMSDMTLDFETTHKDVVFSRRLIKDCSNIKEFISLLEAASIEDCDISLINHFLRVKYLGLTFQLYVKRRIAIMTDNRGNISSYNTSAEVKNALYWPSFMYEFSSNPVLRPSDIFLASGGRPGIRGYNAYLSSIAHIVPAAAESWEHLVAMFNKDPANKLSPRFETVGIFSLMAIWSSSWAFGQRVWADVFKLMSKRAVAANNKNGAAVVDAPLQHLRIYKHYLQFLKMATLADAHKHIKSSGGAIAKHKSDTRKHLVFNDDSITGMFITMDSNGVDFSSGFLCQGIRAALEVGQLDISRVLEQWQLHREQTGVAQPGFMHQWFSSQELPVIPSEVQSVMELVRREKECPRLSQFVKQKTCLSSSSGHTQQQ